MKIDIKDLSVNYKEKIIIDHLSIQVAKGCFFTILGNSGSGKSTILKALAGLINPTKGTIALDGVVVNQRSVAERQIAFVFQKPLLFPHLTVAENINFGPNVNGWKKKAIDERRALLMSLLQIDGLESRMPTEISGGQQQRVALGRALALNHHILFMDEPFSSLDPYLKEDMYTLLKRIQKELDLTIIFVTHDVREAIVLSDQIGFLEDGHLIQVGEPNDLYNRPKTKTIAEFMGQVNWVNGYVENDVFISPFGAVHKAEGSLGKKLLLLRPQDLEIRDDGIAFQVTHCMRVGKETIIKVKKDDCALTIHQLQNADYKPGEWVNVGIRNDYQHIITA